MLRSSLGRRVVTVTAWGKLAEVIVKWYLLFVVWYAVLWILWILSGSNPYNMVTNLTAALTGLIAMFILIEILRRKIKLGG
jgi:hypothetical protein